MNNLRFKTEKEFIKEYGLNYDIQLLVGWNCDMDHFFGKPFNYKMDERSFNRFLKGEIFLIVTKYSKRGISDIGWSISSDMLKYDFPNYKPFGKIKREL